MEFPSGIDTSWIFQPTLGSSDIGSLADQLAQTTVDANTELNFAGCGLKLNSKADGKITW